MIVWTHYSMMKKDIAQKESYKKSQKESNMKLFEIKTSSIFDDEIRTYYTLAEDMALALEKVRRALPYEETAFVISQKKLVE